MLPTRTATKLDEAYPEISTAAEPLDMYTQCTESLGDSHING